jgi:two-component system sensor histidine kinase DesK
MDVDATAVRAGTPTAGRFDRLWPLLFLVWLPNIAIPLVAVTRQHPAPLRLGVIMAGVTLFVAAYLWSAWQNNLSRAVYPLAPQRVTESWRWVPIVVLALLSVAFILGDGPRWITLLIFTGASVGGRFSLGWALRVLASLMLLTAALGLLTHDILGDLISATFWTGMAGILVIMLNYLRLTNRSLQVAREENTRLAVEAERLRFARDLHDLLGHNLAHIALKSEMAEALAATAPEQASAAMHEVGQVARTALQEVRAAVAGYRRPTLAGELRGAREIRAAAGIGFQYQGESRDLPPDVEAVLAWTVREGVINVIRHSRARRCTIELLQGQGEVGIEVSDDGRGPAGGATAPLPETGGGSGLQGLAERAGAIGGRFAAGPRPGGGFRVAVIVPLAAEKAAEDRGTLQAGASVPR